ncbi:MAG TPA: hypothetical protein VFG42_10860 [Baekduia sp.]|uniref:hypothetical protein n=1 Tax=Baekduia sp. TaxID=2600305 RepID=UPI002D768F4B|nr:hypothetical protein [Baekduia sp.]HET6507279.1 hypothetical protein [Baekduia sp.]
MRRRAAEVWVIAVLAAAAAWCAPAGAAQVSGSLQVTATTSTSVSFTFTVKRVCSGGEQCDYFSELDQLTDASACPATRPHDPWILWTGDVQNTGPATETGRARPRGWSGAAVVGPTRLCLYTFTDGDYTLVATAVITRPSGGDPGDASPGGDGSTPTTTQPGGGTGSGTGAGGATPKAPLSKPSARTVTCLRYTYQQDAQKALKSDKTLAARLDRNGNGVACENLPKHKRYVATIALRDAATATRAALRRSHGTAFAAGSRYHARCRRTARTRVRCAVAWRHGGTWTGYVDVVSTLRANERVVATHVHVRRSV